MPNSLTGLGLQFSTRQEWLDYFTTQFQAIYGADINLASDTPDGQWLNIMIQAILDQQDVVTQVYNSFDPDLAIGNVLDQRVAINGIQRQAGTYTITPVTVVNAQSVNLYGLDGSSDPSTDTPARDDGQTIYTVQDNAGNKFFLETTELGLGAGSHVLSFRAAVPGIVLTVPNTITVPVTVVLGVTSVNNPTAYTTLGINEESDALLRLRRQKSVALSSQGYLAGLLAALENTAGVTSAFVYENDTDTTNIDGVPGHSIWVIVAGTATAADIAQAIYVKRNAGCGMYGQTSYNVIQIDGTLFTIFWDTVIIESAFVAFTVTSIDGVSPPNIAAIQANIVTGLIPSVYQTINVNQIATLAQATDPNALVTNVGLSVAKTQTLTLSGVPASGTFKLNYGALQTTTLNWNDSVGTIQTALRALAGLSTVVVTGSLASQSLVVNLTTLDSVADLIFVSSNTLQTSGPAAITFAYNEGYTNTLVPSSKRNQFVLSEADVYILPMQLSPSSSIVEVSQTLVLQGLGGYGTFVYSVQTDHSGCTIDATTGLYTAGTTDGTTDTLKVTDVFGNTATATVNVTAA